MQPQRELPRELKQKIYRFNILGFVIVSAIPWVLAILELKMGIIIVGSAENPMSPMFHLIFGLVVTLISGVVFYHLTRKNLRLAEYGIEVPAQISNISLLRKSGIGPVSYDYEYNGKTYSGKQDMLIEKAKQLQESGSFILLIDPKNPKRADLKDHVLMIREK